MLETVIKSIGLGNWLNLGISPKEIIAGFSIIIFIAYIKAMNIRESRKW